MQRILFSALAMAGLFTLLAATPADACRDHEAGLPASASADSALAEYLRATEGMNKRERKAFRQSMTEEQRQILDAEVRALPAEERKALTKAMRQNPNKLRPNRSATTPATATKAEEPQG
ncbi:MAG: hypothetical protein AAFY88_04560 [Acidobacteriota bacterium]